MTTDPHRHIVSVDEFERMISAGVYGKSDRLELLNGEIVEMAPIGERHAAKVDRLTQSLVTALAGRAIVRVQGPIRADDTSRPEPDIAVLRYEADFYETRLPRPEDVLLLIEVSGTSRSYDRGTKVPLYARVGVPVVWLVDLADDAITVFSSPDAESYHDVATFTAGELPAVPDLDELSLSVADVF